MNDLSRGRMVYYAIILVVAPVIIYFFAVKDMRFFKVPSRSMEPTLYPGDYLVTLSKGHYDRGEVVVLSDREEPGAYIVKRIVGVPGDTVELKGGALFINGKYASEPYIAEPLQQHMNPVVVPPGGVFLMGDNRNLSEDGSEWQEALQASTIVGSVRLRYLPLDRFSRIHRFPLKNYDGA